MRRLKKTESDVMSQPFADRRAAGEALASLVAGRGYADPVVLALPRGGAPVAEAIAERLDAPLDLMIVRKIGAPREPELAVAAIADGTPPHIVFNRPVMGSFDLSEADLARGIARERDELARRRICYAAGRPRLPVAGRTAILVDDGVATGTTARAALEALAREKPAKLVLAVPVGPPDEMRALGQFADEVIVLAQPRHFGAVGAHYRDFHQLGDAEVLACLHRAAARGVT